MTIPIKDHLKLFIDSDKDWKIQLLQKWPDIIGSLHDKVSIEKIYDDTIILSVFHSCWMQELYLLSPLLIKKINEKLDSDRIKQVRFKQAGTKKQKKEKRHKINRKKELNITLTHKEKSTLEKIADPQLRKVLKAFLIRCYRE